MTGPKTGTLLRWLGIALLVALPTFARYELSNAVTWSCHRDGARAGQCYGEPTLYHRLGLSPYWDPKEPRIESMQIVPLVDVGRAEVLWDGTLSMHVSDACWKRYPPGFSWCHATDLGMWHVSFDTGDGRSLFQHQDTVEVAARWNAFLDDPSQPVFRLRRPTPLEPWHMVVYGLAGLLLVFNVWYAQRRRTRAWLEAVDEIPPTKQPAVSAYRG